MAPADARVEDRDPDATSVDAAVAAAVVGAQVQRAAGRLEEAGGCARSSGSATRPARPARSDRRDLVRGSIALIAATET
jgi:hypothetical protein